MSTSCVVENDVSVTDVITHRVHAQLFVWSTLLVFGFSESNIMSYNDCNL